MKSSSGFIEIIYFLAGLTAPELLLFNFLFFFFYKIVKYCKYIKFLFHMHLFGSGIFCERSFVTDGETLVIFQWLYYKYIGIVLFSR